MDNDRIHRLLTELHRELSGAGAIDAESRRLLDQVLTDLQQLSPSPGDVPEEPTAQLQEAALRLEAEHPRLAVVIGQLADTLAKLGI
jgi:hypothetical protein